MLLNGGAIATMVEWHGVFFFVNRHRQFVKGVPLWQHHRLQWRVYMAELWPSAVFFHPPLITLLKCDRSVGCYSGVLWELPLSKSLK